MKKQKRTSGAQTVRATDGGLEAVQANVAGIDLGSRQMHVCGPPTEAGNAPLRVFDTTTNGIRACAKWLKELSVQSIAMESTGVYWIPVMDILESEGFTVLLVDTRPLSRVPGRKTDYLDCQWIQLLHSCGLLQGCFRPKEMIEQLRGLARAKATLVNDQSDWLRRMQKTLDQMNVRIHHAVSDLQGTTGMAILRAIVRGERDPRNLAKLRDPRCRHSEQQIVEFLTGHWRADHLFHLEQSLAMYDVFGQQIAAYEQELNTRVAALAPATAQAPLAPVLPNKARMQAFKRRGQDQRRHLYFQWLGVDLTSIDGVGVETIEVLLSEYGPDLSPFPNEKQFVAHLRLAPSQAISGGKALKKKHKSKADNRAGRALCMAATVMGRSPTALGAYYRRISRTKGAGVAVFATARKIATLIYRLLRWGKPYVDEGQQAYEARFQANRIRSLSVAAAQLGLHISPKTEPASPL